MTEETLVEYDPMTGERCAEHGIPGCLRSPHAPITSPGLGRGADDA